MPESDYRIEAGFDYARGSFDRFDRVEGSAKHTRALFYVRGGFWIVVDRIETDRPRTVQTLWHWHPDCTVVERDGQVLSTDQSKGNLRIVPLGDTAWEVKMVKGQAEPRPQGWYSEKYNSAEPASTAIYSASLDGTTAFAWILVPAKGDVPEVEARIMSQDKNHVSVTVVDGQKNRFEITVPLTGDSEPVME